MSGGSCTSAPSFAEGADFMQLNFFAVNSPFSHFKMCWRAEAAQLEGTAKRRGGQDFVAWLGKDIFEDQSGRVGTQAAASAGALQLDETAGTETPAAAPTHSLSTVGHWWNTLFVRR